MADRIHPSMHSMQLPLADPLTDRILAGPDVDELRKRHDSMLSSRNSSHSEVDRLAWGAFFSHGDE